MSKGDATEPEPSARLRHPVRPGRKATATGEEPGFELELTCLACGHRARVRLRREWSCAGNASHARVHVRAIPIRT